MTCCSGTILVGMCDAAGRASGLSSHLLPSLTALCVVFPLGACCAMRVTVRSDDDTDRLVSAMVRAFDDGTLDKVIAWLACQSY
jgi:hypothetical protein